MIQLESSAMNVDSFRRMGRKTMSEWEVSVREYQHITVEAETEEEAREKAMRQSKFDNPHVYQDPVNLNE